jgi:hypothetical protein
MAQLPDIADRITLAALRRNPAYGYATTLPRKGVTGIGLSRERPAGSSDEEPDMRKILLSAATFLAIGSIAFAEPVTLTKSQLAQVVAAGNFNGNGNGNGNSGNFNGNKNGNFNSGSFNGNLNGNGNWGSFNGNKNGNRNSGSFNGNLNGNGNWGSVNGNLNGNFNSGSANGNLNGNGN